MLSGRPTLLPLCSSNKSTVQWNLCNRVTLCGSHLPVKATSLGPTVDLCDTATSLLQPTICCPEMTTASTPMNLEMFHKCWVMFITWGLPTHMVQKFSCFMNVPLQFLNASIVCDGHDYDTNYHQSLVIYTTEVSVNASPNCRAEC